MQFYKKKKQIFRNKKDINKIEEYTAEHIRIPQLQYQNADISAVTLDESEYF